VNEETVYERTVVERVRVPPHPPRRESRRFRRNRATLLARVGRCWVDNDACAGELEVHHLVEWSLAGHVDFDRLARVLRAVDPYGYGRRLRRRLRDIDDIRNLVVLCERHHRAAGFGIHALTLPVWLAVAARRDGAAVTVEEREATADATNATNATNATHVA
jgi:hypothetical protein